MSPTNTNSNLPPGFSTIEEAIALIRSDTRQAPVVDMDYLITHIKWVEVAHNFRIPKVKRLAPKDVYRTKRGKLVEYEKTGEVNISIVTPYDKELVRKTILDKYRELVGHEYKEQIIKGRSTVADDAQGRDAVRPRINKPNTKEGDTIGYSGEMVSNGENLQV